MKILIVEDEKELSQSICEYLSGEQFSCEQAFDYTTAIEKISLYDYACIVLDITLPGGSGMNILKELKKQNKLDGVLIVSAKNSLDDKVEGLRAGADDYLTKPFYLPELSARVAAIIRRKSFEGKPVVHFGILAVELDKKEVSVSNKKVDLTRKEYELLIYFIANKERV